MAAKTGISQPNWEQTSPDEESCKPRSFISSLSFPTVISNTATHTCRGPEIIIHFSFYSFSISIPDNLFPLLFLLSTLSSSSFPPFPLPPFHPFLFLLSTLSSSSFPPFPLPPFHPFLFLLSTLSSSSFPPFPLPPFHPFLFSIYIYFLLPFLFNILM
ncbi:unnamed protein product [Acanthosepion pharaonis]|uniref:Uncharacterized protein n=1 Tax=Acanthosepion pharaonis TaxID=158019 RepID=A0A812DDN4_ACAPH|nr:unnamed protein product [Sepia pharaonis]